MYWYLLPRIWPILKKVPYLEKLFSAATEYYINVNYIKLVDSVVQILYILIVFDIMDI